MNLEDIGQKAFSFALIYALLTTVFTIAMLSAGINPPATFKALYLPSTFFSKFVMDLRSKLPSNYVPSDVFATMATITAVAAIVQFVFSLLWGFLALITVFAYIIPAECSFLVPVLYFIGAFLQGMVWYYVIVRVLSKLRMWFV